MTDSLKGRLLVATPGMGDPNFDRTVVLMIEHNAEGALGVVLNRPSDIDLGGPLPEWDRLAAHPAVVFVGGPVAQGAVICLARMRTPTDPEGWSPVVGPVGALHVRPESDEIDARVEELRVFSGYAGWGPDQLEGEIEAGGWFVADAQPDDSLSLEPDGLWRRVLLREGGTLALFANFPADPSMN